MYEKAVLVYVEWQREISLVGRLFTRNRKGRESASFEYSNDWLQNKNRFALEPALSLYPAPFHTPENKTLFGAIGDSAPDRWGRMLIRSAERMAARVEGREARTLQEIDFLLRVDDESRQGALRFAEREGGPFLAPINIEQRIPLILDLTRLLNASDKIKYEDDNASDSINILLGPGSSLGGARPKASVCDNKGNLFIAKFPHPVDEIDIPAWESVTLNLAVQAGINTTEHKLEKISDRSVILLKRFDRIHSNRVPFLSAMSLLNATDNEHHSYLEIADALRHYGGEPVKDLKELWRRIVFSILVSNTDDHLRNHGFLLYDPTGWRLSPAYDINPTPIDIKARRLTTAIDEENTSASLDLAISVSDSFGITLLEGKLIAKEVAAVTSRWHKEAKQIGIKAHEIDRMRSAFEHNELHQALSY